MKNKFVSIIGVFVIFTVFFVPAHGFTEEAFDTGRFSYYHYGEKFYQYEFPPFSTLASESFTRCYFTSDFVLSENSFSDSGHVTYKFPNDMVWPGGYENSTFYIVRSPSFNFPEDNNFETLIPTKTADGSIVLEFDIVPGLNTFVANHTAFWDSQKSQTINCENPFDHEKQDPEYYDFVYPLKVQQNRAEIFDLEEHDFLCKSELSLIKKYDGSPACVKPVSILKLTERGWAEISKNETTLDSTGHTWDCASVSVEKLSSNDLETLQNIPYENPLKFLKFTDEHLEQSKILKTLVDTVNSRDYPLNERGYAELQVEQIIQIQQILLEKLISKYGGTEEDYSREPDPIRYYDDDPNKWKQDAHRWEDYLTGFSSPTILYQENLYDINGLGSNIRSHNLEERINIQLLDITKEEYLEQYSKRNFVEITENEMDMMSGIKDAILQIGTWESSIKENQYTGDKIQQETMDYFREETKKQFPEFENGYVVDFTYAGNYYRTEYLVC